MNEKNVTIEDLHRILHRACREGALNTVRNLLSLGLNVDGLDENGNSIRNLDGPPLLQAVAGCSTPVVKLLLKRGANPNLESVRGTSPLFLACDWECDNIEFGKIARLLLDHGADIDRKDHHYGLSPIQSAVRNGAYQTVERLCKLGANLELTCDYGSPEFKTPLMSAVHYFIYDIDYIGREMLEILLDHAANVNGTNELGKTALMYAAEHDSAEAVELLLAGGANPFLKDHSGETALDKTQDTRVRVLLQCCHRYNEPHGGCEA